MAKHSTTVQLFGIYDSKKLEFEKKTKQFLDAINIAYCANNIPELPATISNNEINKVVGGFWALSPFFSVDPTIKQNVLSTLQGNFEIRNLQVAFEKDDTDYKQKSAVLIFDKFGNIIDFKISLNNTNYNAMTRNPKDVTDLRQRQMIIDFVENYRTYHILKDIDNLKKVYSDKAIIVVGKVISVTQEDQLKPIELEDQVKAVEKVKYTRYTLGEYIPRLDDHFARANIINVGFHSIDVIQHPKQSHIYGVNLIQTWHTEFKNGDEYLDKGNLFLMIDCSRGDSLKVWVRTWDKEKTFSLYNFPIPVDGL